MGLAATLFFSADAADDTLNRRVRPTDEQLEYLRLQKDDLQEFLTAELAVRCGCDVSTWLQGSYKLHTLIRPMNRFAEYDVDLGVYLEWDDNENDSLTSSEVRTQLQNCLSEYSATRDAVRQLEQPLQRCSRISYQENFHIDVPAYHYDTASTVTRLATLSKDWEYSDPEKMVTWFQERLDGDARAQVRRVVRYLKAWARLRLRDEKDACPSSLCLTVLAVNAYVSAIGERRVDDDEALRDVGQAVRNRLHESAHVENPVETDQDRNLNRLADDAFNTFMSKLQALCDTADRALTRESQAEAASDWIDEFEHLFPLPDTAGLAAEDSGRSLIVPTPEIDIDISDALRGRVKRTNSGQALGVRQGEHLHFRVTNPQVIPAGSEVRWVVRNGGHEALSANDLGHSRVDTGSLANDEHAEYLGRHFMDCEVRLHRQLRSITRIPVLINNLPAPQRNPPRPAYTKLRARRR